MNQIDKEATSVVMVHRWIKSDPLSKFLPQACRILDLAPAKSEENDVVVR